MNPHVEQLAIPYQRSMTVMIWTLRVMGLVLPQYVIASYHFRPFPLFPLVVILPHSGLIYDNTPLDLFQLCLVVFRLVVSTLRLSWYINPVYT